MNIKIYKKHMEDIYRESLEVIEQGYKWSINLDKHSLRVGKKYIIKDGKYEGCLGTDIPKDKENLVSQLEHLYDRYKHSVPTEMSEHRNKFPVCSERDLNDEDMMFGERRNTAQFKFEFYVLCMALQHSLDGLDFWNSDRWYFWQSQNDSQLVLLRKWFN